MQPRNSIVKIFSTFLQFDGDRISGWVTVGRLLRSMQNCIQENSQSGSDNFWVVYWYQIWLNKSPQIALEHLMAYLQETCYWTSLKAATSFASTQYTLSDCFQIAIAKVEKVLKGFNLDTGFGLKNYAAAIFSSAIRDTLRQRHEVDICSDWGLLRKISQKRLQESLQLEGLSTGVVEQYIVAWNCFKSLYVPTQSSNTRQLSRPDAQTWVEICQAYQAQIQAEVDPQTVEKWLLICAKSARRYLYPSVSSINVTVSDDGSQEWIDNLTTTDQESPLNAIIQQEEETQRNNQRSQINQVLADCTNQLEGQVQEILQLYYCKGLTQQQIAQELAIKQYTISRRLTKAKETLLRSLAKWSQETLHIPVNSDLIKNMSVVMEEWLQSYYSQSPLLGVGNGTEEVG